MKGTLEFDLPAEETEMQHAIDGGKYLSVIQEVDGMLRNMSKYEGVEKVKVDKVRDMIQEALDNWDLTLWS